MGIGFFNKDFSRFFQILLFLVLNSLFIFKYFVRANINPFISTSIYIVLILSFVYLYEKYSNKISERYFKITYLAVISFMVIGIIALLVIINPYDIRVDRWSALTFFWDYALRGDYPYGAHTHVCDSNFPSPFPFWHILNFPFYLTGEIGTGLIAFLLLLAISVKYYFISYKKALFFILLLAFSPAYWWEVSVISDSLSNGLLVFVIILWYERNSRTLSNSFLLSIIICGCIAATRMSALIPLALYFFHPYIKLPILKKIIFPVSILGIVVAFFSPYIFWDTTTWVFFSRNPFMSQTNLTSQLNAYVLIIMIIIGIIISLKWRKMDQFSFYSATFIFFFILFSTYARMYYLGPGNLLSDGIADISYLTLSLPYCLFYLTSKIKIE